MLTGVPPAATRVGEQPGHQCPFVESLRSRVRLTSSTRPVSPTMTLNGMVKARPSVSSSALSLDPPTVVDRVRFPLKKCWP